MTVPMPGPPRPADPRSIVPGPVAPGPEAPAAAVARAMAGLDGLAGRPLAEHVDAFERVHTALGEALATGSSGPA
jgi:hypothetical protein